MEDYWESYLLGRNAEYLKMQTINRMGPTKGPPNSPRSGNHKSITNSVIEHKNHMEDLRTRIERKRQVEAEYAKEEARLKKSIEILENRIKVITNADFDLQAEVSKLRKEDKMVNIALEKAEEYYAAMFNMNIEVTDISTNTFTCILHFAFGQKRYPMKFIIDRHDKTVLSWEARSMLSLKDENALKKKLSNVKFMPSILIYLKKLTCNTNMKMVKK